MTHTPIDGSAGVPEGDGSKDAHYLTHDLVSALERATLAWVDTVAQRRGIGKREASVRVLHAIEILTKSVLELYPPAPAAPPAAPPEKP